MIAPTMKKPKTISLKDIFVKDRHIIPLILSLEVISSVCIAGVEYLFGDPFLACLMDHAIPIVCLMYLIQFGMTTFSTLVLNGWRIKDAEEEYPIITSFCILIINVVIFLIIDRRKKFVLLIIPMIAWLLAIVISTVRKWWYRL